VHFTETELQELNREFELADPKAILRWAVETFGETLAIVTSFQPAGIVTLHMLDELRRDGVKPRPQVLTLDTGLLFPETYALMDEVEQRFDLRLTRIKPGLTVEEQNAEYGESLWLSNPDACCKIRKVVPLDRALAKSGSQAWVAGLRRDQPGRANTPLISWDRKHEMVKLAPMANWNESMVWTYIHAYELPYNTLHDQGYPSIGCKMPTCTQPVTNGESSRAGRWVNHAKNECGIHLAVS
jgi:phosphoadenosine phosphosulfate reductase